MRRAVIARLLALLLAMVAVQLSTLTPARGLAVPPSFTVVDYATGQAKYNLTNFAWLPDGGLLTSGKDGTITYVPPGGEPRVLTKVPSVRAVGDHGLLGLAPANDYATSGRVYVAYDRGDTNSTGFGMVEEWTASPPAAPSSFRRSRTILDGSLRSPQLAQLTHLHGIDTVLVAPDDTLFVSVGDDAWNNGDPKTLRAQNLDQPYGKLLRLTPDGSGVPSNPFYDPARPGSWRSMIYAYGFRNPFRFSLDPRSGVPHLGDVGWGTHEEINTLAPGANAGWPCFEGSAPTTFSSTRVCKVLSSARSALMPIWTYPHAGSGAAVVGGMHYNGTSYPAQYRGSYFFGDYARQRLWTLRTDATGKLTRAPEANGFARDAGGPVAFHPGPNGDVTYADTLSGNVRRVVYAAGNRAPTAKFTTTTDAGKRTVSLTATDSYDLDGDALTYAWDLGDGTSATGETATHTYGGPDDQFVVTLTVKDQLGAVGRSTTTVFPDNRTPTIILQKPANTTTYRVNDTVQLSASATDPEDGALTVTWDTALLHCPFAGSCHRHPDGTVTGPAFSTPFTDHGADTTMLVTANAVDSKGAAVTATFEARPRLRTLAISSPVAVSINGAKAASAQVVVGSRVHVSAPQTSTYWRFQSWSDGGKAAHSLTMPDADLSVSVRYETAIAARYAAIGGSSSVLGTPTSVEYNLAAGRARNYTGGRLFWSAATGAHIVRGPILTKYLATGGPSKYGFPTSDVTKVKGGNYAHFTGRRSIFWASATGAHLVYGALRKKYAAMGYQRSCLGFPTTDQYRIKGGVRNRFVGGRITRLDNTRFATARCR